MDQIDTPPKPDIDWLNDTIWKKLNIVAGRCDVVKSFINDPGNVE